MFAAQELTTPEIALVALFWLVGAYGISLALRRATVTITTTAIDA